MSRQERASLILEKYSQLAGSKTLAFCASINHADYMAEFFNVHGVRAAGAQRE